MTVSEQEKREHEAFVAKVRAEGKSFITELEIGTRIAFWEVEGDAPVYVSGVIESRTEQIMFTTVRFDEGQIIKGTRMYPGRVVRVIENNDLEAAVAKEDEKLTYYGVPGIMGPEQAGSPPSPRVQQVIGRSGDISAGVLGPIRATPPLHPALGGSDEMGRPFGIGVCRVCGCSDLDCSGCIQRTGEPCHWVEADLCSACVPEKEAA